MKRKGFVLFVLLMIFAVAVVLLTSGRELEPLKVETTTSQIKEVETTTFQIKGVVDKVEYIAEASSFYVSNSIKKTIVKFKDGRVRAFNGISNEVFQEGKVNVITYDRRNRILSVKID